MLQAALFEIMDIRLAHESVAPRKQTRKEEIMARFILEVCRYFQKERQVSFYAKKLWELSHSTSAQPTSGLSNSLANAPGQTTRSTHSCRI